MLVSSCTAAVVSGSMARALPAGIVLYPAISIAIIIAPATISPVIIGLSIEVDMLLNRLTVRVHAAAGSIVHAKMLKRVDFRGDDFIRRIGFFTGIDVLLGE